MNVVLRKPMTVDDYLAWAAVQPEDGRTELVNGQVVAMSPERAIHRRLKFQIAKLLDQACAGRPDLHVEPDGATVRIDTYTAYEPDALIYAGPMVLSHSVEIEAPVVVVEIISPSSRHHDNSAKLVGYFQLASVQHYLLIDPDAKVIVCHSRQNDGAQSVANYVAGPVRLDPPGIEIDAGQLFSGI